MTEYPEMRCTSYTSNIAATAQAVVLIPRGLDTTAAAARLRVDPATARRYFREGRIPSRETPGRRYQVREAAGPASRASTPAGGQRAWRCRPIAAASAVRRVKPKSIQKLAGAVGVAWQPRPVIAVHIPLALAPITSAPARLRLGS